MNDPSAKPPSALHIADTLLALLAQRALTASICPSEVARALAGDDGDWRGLMPDVRSVAAQLAKKAAIRVTQGEREVDALEAVGPIRLRKPLR